MLQTWNLLVYVARLRKTNTILWRTLAEIVEKIKLTKLKYLITAWLHSNNGVGRGQGRHFSNIAFSAPRLLTFIVDQFKRLLHFEFVMSKHGSLEKKV